MDLVEFISQMRSDYLGYFQQTYDRLQSSNVQVAMEIPVELSSGRPYTIDFIQTHADGRKTVVEVAPPVQPAPQPFAFNYQGLAVHFDGATWDAMAIATPGCTPVESALVSWQTRWMDMEGTFRPTKAQFGNVIHSLIVEDQQIHVDMGTSNPEAFFALMDVLLTSGCREIEVTSDRS